MIVSAMEAREALDRLWRDIPVGSGKDLNVLHTYMEELECRLDRAQYGNKE